MRPRHLLSLLGGLLALAAACTREPRRPNVLLVSIDSLRADHVHAYGYERETSPTIDALAAEGVRFGTAISPSSWTLPSHVTLLTSLSPAAHRVERRSRRLSKRAVTLAEVLRGAGYETAAIVGGPLLQTLYGHDQGFDRYDESVAIADDDGGRDPTSPALVDRAIEWVRGWSDRGGAQPFFLFLHLWDVHYDYAPPPPYDTMFDPDYRGELRFADFERNPNIHGRMAQRDLQHLLALYDGEIRFTDEHLGRLIQTLQSSGVLDDTIVVVTADHGDEFFEHRSKGHWKTVYDEIVRVPFVLRYPRRVPARQVIDGQVRLMDIGPTILSLAGVRAPPDFGGGNDQEIERAWDLSPWIVGGKPGGFPPLLAFSRVMGRRNAQQQSVRTTNHKLIVIENPPRTSLYDLRTDARETADIAGSRQGARLARRLKKALELQRRLGGRDSTGFSEKFVPDRAHEERLRALGYVE